MHRAPSDSDGNYSGPYKPLHRDTIGSANNLDDGELITIKRGNFIDSLNNPVWLNIRNGRLGLNIDFLHPTYALYRRHEFIVVGLTSGDPKVDASLTDGEARSVVSLDLDGDGDAEEWTLGTPSAPFTIPDDAELP